MTEALYSRNWAFVDEATQSKLSTQRLFTAGTGLGSVIATLAARTGFRRFTLADGDAVDVSNLNRQAFLRHHVGTNKALATADLIFDVQPAAAVKVIPAYLTADSMPELIEGADLVVNTIDFDDPVFLDCNRLARAAGRPVFLPLNLGFGAAVYVFDPNGPTIEETFQAELVSGGPSAIRTALVLGAVGPQLYPYMEPPIARFLNPGINGWPYDPQLGIAAHVAAALTVSAAVAWVQGTVLQCFPKVARLDAWAAVTGESRRGSG